MAGHGDWPEAAGTQQRPCGRYTHAAKEGDSQEQASEEPHDAAAQAGQGENGRLGGGMRRQLGNRSRRGGFGQGDIDQPQLIRWRALETDRRTGSRHPPQELPQSPGAGQIQHPQSVGGHADAVHARQVDLRQLGIDLRQHQGTPFAR